VAAAYAFAISSPSLFGSLSGCTAIKVGTPACVSTRSTHGRVSPPRAEERLPIITIFRKQSYFQCAFLGNAYSRYSYRSTYLLTVLASKGTRSGLFAAGEEPAGGYQIRACTPRAPLCLGTWAQPSPPAVLKYSWVLMVL
jgi:hypothetical protein